MGWMISYFFDGMVILLLSFWAILIPLILLYLFSFFETIVSLILKSKNTSKIKLIAHGIVLLSIISFNIYHSDLFKSKRVLTAVLRDDQYSYRLIFRENGEVENQLNGFLGYSKTYHGTYFFKNNLIIFKEKPYVNDFVPDTLLLDKSQGAIFIYKEKSGRFYKKKDKLSYFKIE